jgi:hypothetical protein
VSGPYSDVRDLVVTGSGAIASTVRPYDAELKPLPLEVHKFDADRADRLDVGPEIGATFLTSSWNVVTWTHGAESRSAVLR